MRIKLPGDTKSKAIILIILVIVAFGILIKEKKDNSKNIRTKKIAENTIVEAATEIKNIQNENNEELEKKYNEAYENFFKKNYEEAIKIANDIINKDENYYKAYNIRGIVKAYNGDFHAGMKDIDKALELKNDYGYGRFNKALAYELYSYYDKSLQWYNKALETEEYVWSYYGIASIYGRKGDLENTIKYLKKAIQLDPAVKNVAKDEEDFNPVKNNSDFQKLIS